MIWAVCLSSSSINHWLMPMVTNEYLPYQKQTSWGVTGRAELASEQAASENPFSLLSYEAALRKHFWGKL